MKTAAEINEGLNQFTGTEHYHRYSPLFPKMLLSDGVLWLCENADCLWLADAVASHQPKAMKDASLRDMQFWTLKVHGESNKSATLTCERDTDDVAITQEIEYTDFPLPEIKLYVGPATEDGEMLCYLPSEY